MTRAPATLMHAEPMRPPRATARLQLNHRFGFDDALAQLDYLDALGVSHLFVSPILSARAGSLHGYDVIDHRCVNPELGAEAGLRRLVAGLRERGMGLIVDVVPNHMAVGGHDNPRWLDVLEWGPDSRNANFFDIDWDVPETSIHRRVLLPFLGTPYGEALAAGELVLKCDRGRLLVAYHEHWFPISPRHYAELLSPPELASLAHRFRQAMQLRGRDARQLAVEQAKAVLVAAADDTQIHAALAGVMQAHDARVPAGRARLHRLLERQHYRLAWWRNAADEINWRRFFDINELAALRIQEASVFEAVHATIFRLYAEGLIDGLRIDHVDGLAYPRAYCRQLRARLAQLAASRPVSAPAGPAYIVVEKILAPQELLARDWQVDGTSGYSFMNNVSALLHDGAGEAALSQLWSELHGGDYAEEERRARRRVAQELFSADFFACAHALHQIARSDPATRDWSVMAIRRVLLELLVHFPVYRTYADFRGRSAADAAIMQRVVTAAEHSCRPGERSLVRLVDDWLGGTAPRQAVGAPARRMRLRAMARFQQLTSPLAAKAVEDTVFYRHGRLLSRNEVGSDPSEFAIGIDAFHRICEDQQRRYPGAMLATATHDHKRGEDVRMRLAVLSEIPQRWQQAVTQWRALSAAIRETGTGAARPDVIDEYMFYQMLVGTWPPTLRTDDAPGLAAFTARLVAWQRKAVREAKRHSGWVEPNLEYERACESFICTLLDPRQSGDFLHSVSRFVSTIATSAALKGLSQVLLRNTTPGVPDLYQGTEFWDFSMVDPDNRQVVNFESRRKALGSTAPTATLLDRWQDGAIKQRLIHRVLALRREMPQLFFEGQYQRLRVSGGQAHRVIAYARTLGSQACVIIAPLLPQALREDESQLGIGPLHWQDGMLELPPSLAARQWLDVLEQQPVGTLGKTVALNALPTPWPLALFATMAGG